MSFFFSAAALHRHAVAVLRTGVVCMVCAGPGAGMNAVAADSVDARRARMIEDIAQMARDSARETGRGIFDARVMAALGKVERHRFMPPTQFAHAYENRPLPIGHDQTISQPYVVALMTDLLNIKPGDKVLEIGTGLGYQAAVLAELARAVYTIEIVEPLGRAAAGALAAAGYWNVQPRIGDGYRGWPEEAPFDAIMVTAAAPRVPQPLLDQLKAGGRLVIPLGERGVQALYVIKKGARGGVTQRRVVDVRFVPFTGDAVRGKP